jgi:hypothetical protein
MTKKSVKPEPANLTSAQKEELKKQILKEFPSLAIVSADIDFLIEEYNKDKKYVSRLMKTSNPVQHVVDESKLELIKVVKADTDEWKEITEKMKKSEEQYAKVNAEADNEISNQ